MILRKLLLLLLPISFLSSQEGGIAPTLKGLFFSRTAESDVPSTPGIQILDDLSIPDLPRFTKELTPYLSLPITLPFLENIRDHLVQFYKKQGRAIVNVSIPAEQDITDGFVHFVILEGKLGKVEAEGARWFSNQKIAKQVRAAPGQPIEMSSIQSDVEWLNRNPFRKTTLVLEPGEEVGQTDAKLKVEDQFPLKVSASYENTGNIIAGNSRYITGFTWGNAFGLDHQLNANFFNAAAPRNNWGGNAKYLAPLPWRHLFEVSGSFSQSKSKVDQVFDKTGISWQIAGRYKIPLPFKQQIGIGYDFKQTNNFLEYATNLVFKKSIDISQFVLDYEVSPKLFGKTLVGVTLVLSPGNMTPFNKDKYFKQDRPGAVSNYVYGKLRLEQDHNFAENWNWKWISVFQQASGKLLPKEEFSLGGASTVRGYEENQSVGDNGILIKNEVKAPALKLFRVRKWRHELALLGFCDFGMNYDTDHTILSSNTSLLASIGPGLRYILGETVSVRFDYGFQLHTIHRLQNPSHTHSRGHFAGTLLF